MNALAEATTEIRVPRETVNDDLVKIIEWRRSSGVAVAKGEVLVDIETSKMVLEVPAESSGQLEILHPAGSEVPIGELIGRVVGADGSAATDRSAAGTASLVEQEPVAPASAPAASAPLLFAGPETTVAEPPAADRPALLSARARQLAEQQGLDLAQFAGRGLVREQDVRESIPQLWCGRPACTELDEQGQSGEEGREAGGLKASSAAAKEEENKEKEKEEESCRRDARTTIEEEEEEARNVDVVDVPAWQPRGLLGDAKRSAGERRKPLPVLIWNYFYRNWLLGLLVRVSPRGVINFVHRLRGVRMGRDCYIDPWATLETAYPENITLGDDVRVAAGAILMSHIKPPHHLRDAGLMQNSLKPVKLESHSFVGVNAVVMPGVTVGQGAVVASGAVVMSDVPAYTVVAGNPAKVVKHLGPK